MLWSIIVGGIIGWLAGKLMGSRGGVLRNIILGIDRQEVCQYIQKDYPAWPEE